MKKSKKRLKGDMSNLNDLMQEAGMFKIDDLIDLNSTLPMDYFGAHAGVKDYDTFEHWMVMHYKEALVAKACFELGEWEDEEGDSIPHAEGHCRAFAEIFANWKMMKKRIRPVHRSHEECEYCVLQEVEPPRCEGHNAGETSCKNFKNGE